LESRPHGTLVAQSLGKVPLGGVRLRGRADLEMDRVHRAGTGLNRAVLEIECAVSVPRNSQFLALREPGSSVVRRGETHRPFRGHAAGNGHRIVACGALRVRAWISRGSVLRKMHFVILRASPHKMRDYRILDHFCLPGSHKRKCSS